MAAPKNYHFRTSDQKYIANVYVDGKTIYIKQSKHEQVCIDALEVWRKNN